MARSIRSERKLAQLSPGCHLIILSADPEKDAESADQLKKGGFEVTFCSEARRVNNVIDRIMPKWKTTVLLVDVCLPTLSGFELVRRVLEQYSQEELAVIMMSRHGCGEDRLEATAAGALDLIKKPLTLEAVEVILEKERMRKLKNEIGSMVFGFSYD